MTDYSAEWTTGDLEFKAVSGQFNVDEAQGIVECFVAAVGNKDSVGDIVAPGAFDGSLRRRKPRVVWGHDWNQPIGKVLAIEEVPATDPRLPEKMRAAGVGGLLARVQFNLQSERGREAFYSVAFFGTDQEWSIGYKTIRATYDPNHQANVLQEVELFEVSPVLHGANQLTGTISIKAAQGDRTDSFQKSKWPMFDRTYAARIKADHPEIWDAGGNIKGDDQYEILSKIAEQGGKATTEDQIKALELREAWIARHKGDFQLPGVVAQMKWLAVGTRGEDHMKSVVRDAIAKRNKRSAKSLERRVLISVKGAWSELYDGPKVHNIATDDLIEGNTSVLDDQRPGIGNAIADEMETSILLRVTDENFVIFDAEEDDRTYFMPYHYEESSGRYMFGKPMPVEIELDLRFDSEDENEESRVMDEWESDEEWDDADERGYWADEDESELKAIGDAIGGGPGGKNPDEVVDRNNNGMIFDGTPDERPAPKKKKRGQGAAGPKGPKGPRDKKPAPGVGVRQTPQQRNQVAVARLEQMRRDINKRGSTPQGERAAGEQMQQIGAFLRAAEANDRARNGTPAGPAGPQGPGATVDRMSAAQRRREAVEKLQQRRREINRRGSTPGGERAAGREMQDVGRYLAAAEENQRVRERRVAGRAAGPRGPQRRGGDLQSRRTGNGSVMSWDRQGNLKSYDDPALTIDEIEELETKGFGQAIGGGPKGQNPNEVVDRNNNGVIFDGTPDEQPAPRKKPKKDDRLAKRRAALEASDRDMGPKSTQMNQRNERIDRSVAREQMRGWEPTANGRDLKPAAGRRGAMGPAGPRSQSGAMDTEPGSRFSPSTRPAKGSETRWAPGAADAPRRPKR